MEPVGGRSLTDEIAREGARRMLLAAARLRSAPIQAIGTGAEGLAAREKGGRRTQGAAFQDVSLASAFLLDLLAGGVRLTAPRGVLVHQAPHSLAARAR